jgi:hypothetical protein
MKTFKVQSRRFFQDAHIFNIFNKLKKTFDWKCIWILQVNTYQPWCLDFFSFFNHYYLFHILSKWKTLNFILEYFSKMYTSLTFLKKKKLNLIENTFETCNLMHFNNALSKFLFFIIIIIFFILCPNEKIKFNIYIYIFQDFTNKNHLIWLKMRLIFLFNIFKQYVFKIYFSNKIIYEYVYFFKIIIFPNILFLIMIYNIKLYFPTFHTYI